MKKLLIILLAVLLACTLTACKSPSEMIGEKIGEKIVESALGGNVDIDGDEITIKGDDGSELALGATKWPDDKLASEIPKMTKGKITYVANSDQIFMIAIEEVNKKDYEDYQAEIINSGYTNNTVNYSDKSSTSYFADNGEGITIQLTYNFDAEELSLNAGKEAKEEAEEN